MISYIEGQVLFIDSGYVIVKTAGLGYHVLLHKKALEGISLDQAVAFFIHTHVREDALELYGFPSVTERHIFLMLIGVSGIGPKIAQSILSALAPHDLAAAIVDKNIALLYSIPGIGKKTAERLSLELRDKALKLNLPSSSELSCKDSTRTNLDQAMRSLGYSKSQSDNAVSKLGQDDFNLPFEELIKKALNVLVGSKTL